MASSPGPEAHIQAAKRRLAHLGGIAARTEEAERRILDAAEARQRTVDDELRRLAGRVHTGEDAADRYTELILERGRLAIVAMQAREALGNPA